MGVTIHFEGRLKDQDSFNELIRIASEYAAAMKWQSEPIDEAEVTLLRVKDEKEWDYKGRVRGLALFPHPDCDPVRLEFDENLYMQEYTKTQFAGGEIHLWVIGLLRRIEPLFDRLNVFDEGEYWETGDLNLLKSHIETCREMIQRELQECPHATVKVRMPDGRIIDMMK